MIQVDATSNDTPEKKKSTNRLSINSLMFKKGPGSHQFKIKKRQIQDSRSPSPIEDNADESVRREQVKKMLDHYFKVEC